MTQQNCSVEVFARVTGFFRPVQSWNKGKTEEFGDRNRYSMAQVSQQAGKETASSSCGC